MCKSMKTLHTGLLFVVAFCSTMPTGDTASAGDSVKDESAAAKAIGEVLAKLRTGAPLTIPAMLEQLEG